MAKCAACGRFLKPIEGVRCCGSKCGEAYYHRACVGFPAKSVVAPDWRCPECRKNIARDNKAETPVRSAGCQPNPTSGTSNDDVTLGGSMNTDDIEDIQNSSSIAGNSRESSPNIRPEYHAIITELRAVREELSSFRRHMEDELATLRGTVLTYNERVEGLEKRLETLEKRTLVSEKVDNAIDELRQQLNDREQDLLANDIEINNIPEANSENPVHVVMAIGTKLGVSMEVRDIVSAERAGRRQLNAGSPEGPTELRPRSIVVRLARRDLRDELLKNARVRRGATTADLDMEGPAKRFYLHERLTRTNRQLFRRAREAAERAAWRFVWTKRGRILACRKPGDPTRHIRSETDIQTVITPTNVSP